LGPNLILSIARRKLAMEKDVKLREEFAKRLRGLRDDLGLTQKEAAAKVSVGTNAWASYEQGESAPSLETLVAIADRLRTSVDHLLGRDLELSTSAEEGSIKWKPVWSSGPEGNDALAVQAWKRVIAGQPIDEIARSLHVGSKEVEDRLRDLVFHDRIRLLEVSTDCSGKWLKEHFGQGNQSPLREVWVARLGHINPLWVRMVLLGVAARKYFMKTVRPGDTVALCGGLAVSRLVMELRRGDIPPGVTVVPVAVSPIFEEPNVSANGLVSSLAYRHYGLGIGAEELPPCLGGDAGGPATQIANRVLGLAENASVVFLGIGAAGTGALAKDISDVRADYQWLAGVNVMDIQRRIEPVGNVMYHLVDDNGKPLEDFSAQNERLVVSIKLAGLQRIVRTGRRVVILATGKNKARVVRASIRGGLVNSLVIDDELEAELLSMSS